MDAALRSRLAGIAGDKAVDGDSVSPQDTGQVEQVCAACAEAGVRIAVSSGGAAKPPSGAVLVKLGKLNRVEVQAERLLVRAGAGASLGAVRAAVEKAGMTLGAVPAGTADAPVGELVARGALSRRALTGVEVVLAGGGRVGAGGSVLKDVAGYDLVGAMLGSLGRLGLVTAASLRLQPRGTAPGDGAPAGIPTPVLGDALERAFDPQRLLVGRG
jgi:FAD/FMN-containing dehydrogenase